MNSSQALYPCLADSWVSQTLKTVEYCRLKNIALVSSVGINSWELVTALAIERKIPLILFYPMRKNQSVDCCWNEVVNQFEAKNSSIRFHPLPYVKSSHKEKTLLLRDRKIIETADIIFPVSLKANSRLTGILQAHQNKIDASFTVPYQKRATPAGYTICKEQINPQLEKLNDEYLFHWTKTSRGNWPDESLLAYYIAVSLSATYPRTANATLQHIVDIQRILASNTHIATREKVVSFSNERPSEMYSMFKWRSRYREMSFEPYAIGIEKKTALELGIRQVRYYDQNDTIEYPKWLTQSNGKKTDWRREKEFRHKGDFDFSTIDKCRLVLITRYKKEAACIEQTSGIRSFGYTQ